MSSGTLYLVRHGETASNLASRYAGWGDEALTDVGRRQVSVLATQVQDLGIGEVWTSEMRRSQETAQIFSRTLVVPVRADERLNEIRMGPWEGLTEVEVTERYPEAHELWQRSPDLLQLEGRETLDMVARRVLDVLCEARQRPEPVIVVSHVALIRVALLRLLGLPLRCYKGVRVENADCFAVEYPTMEVRRLGSRESLRSELRLAPSD